MPVRAGWFNDDDFASPTASMAAAIAAEFEAAWRHVYGMPLPEAGEEQRRIFFVAIARGVLRYLEHHESDFIDSITLQIGSEQRTYGVPGVNLDTDLQQERP